MSRLRPQPAGGATEVETMNLLAFLHRKPVARVHAHNKSVWAGDVWNYGDPEDGTTDSHVTRWRCSCGVVWTEGRAFDEFPHLIADR